MSVTAAAQDKASEGRTPKAGEGASDVAADPRASKDDSGSPGKEKSPSANEENAPSPRSDKPTPGDSDASSASRTENPTTEDSKPEDPKPEDPKTENPKTVPTEKNSASSEKRSSDNVVESGRSEENTDEKTERNTPAKAPLLGSAKGWREWLHLKRGPVKLMPVALLGVQAMPYVGDQSYLAAGDLSESPGFRLRYGRLGLGGQITEQVRFRFSADLATGDDEASEIHAAWVSYRPLRQVGIKAGVQRPATTRSTTLPSVYQSMIERPLTVRAMTPNDQLGLVAEGHFAGRLFGYHVGVFNGLRRGDSFFAGYKDRGGALGNRFDGLAYVTRLTSEPVGPLSHTVADEEKGALAIGFGGTYTLNRGGAATTHIAGGDVHLQVRGFHALAEVMWSLSLPDTVPTIPSTEVDDVSSLGISVDAGYTILPKQLALGARFEWLDPNQRNEDSADAWLLQAGATYQLLDQLLEAKANYLHRQELYGASQSNDAVILQLAFVLHPRQRSRQ